MSNQKSYQSSFILLTTLFFLWGCITVLVNSLIPRLRKLFTWNYVQAGLVQFAFFGAYFLLSIPASYTLSKIAYNQGIILGLLTDQTAFKNALIFIVLCYAYILWFGYKNASSKGLISAH